MSYLLTHKTEADIKAGDILSRSDKNLSLEVVRVSTGDHETSCFRDCLSGKTRYDHLYNFYGWTVTRESETTISHPAVSSEIMLLSLAILTAANIVSAGDSGNRLDPVEYAKAYLREILQGL